MADPLMVKKRQTAATTRIENALPALAARFGVTLEWPGDNRRDPQLGMAQKLEAIADFVVALAGEEPDTSVDTSDVISDSTDGDDGVVVDNTTAEVIEDGEGDGDVDPASLSKAQLAALLDDLGIAYKDRDTHAQLLEKYQQGAQAQEAEDESEEE